MELLQDIEAIDLALYLNSHKTLILADFHIGFEEALRKQGVLVPKTHYKDLINRLELIFAKIKPEKRVIIGDLKHEFGTISKQEWKETMRLLDYLEKKCKKITLIKGNHDTILGPIARKKNIEIVEKLILGNILLIHGDKRPKLTKKIKIIIIGHEHPALTLREKAKCEKFKCYLKGTYKRKKLIVMPSFNLLTEGTDILKEKTLSPLLDQNLNKSEVYLVDDRNKEVLYFGELGKLN